MNNRLKSTGDCSIPAIGLGTWKLKGKECEKIVRKALDIGYRHIDTASFYDNEEKVGNALEEHRREKLFVTTKVWKDKLQYEDFKESAEKSLKKLKTNYIDLLLIHWPSTEVPLEETIRAMNELVEEDKVLHLGVSNFDIPQLKKAKSLSEYPIVTNQIKYHLGMDINSNLSYCQDNNTFLTAYSPLGRGKVLNKTALNEIADKYEKTPSQIALKWLIDQENVLAIPKTSSDDHLKENIRLFDWELEKKDTMRLDKLASAQ